MSRDPTTNDSRRRWLRRGAALGLAATAAASGLGAATAWAQTPALDHSYAAWDALLKKHVRWLADNKQSRVDYKGFAADRAALQKVLADSARDLGSEIRLGVTAERIEDDGARVHVTFSDGTSASYDLVIGADGVFSQTRAAILPEAESPRFTGQSVWRYNFPRAAGLDALQAYNGPTGVGLVPKNEAQMYMYVTTPEPDNPR